MSGGRRYGSQPVRVGILTGGGDCPGLNAVIRAIVRKGEMVHGDEVVGFLDAWEGVLQGRTVPLDVRTMRGMLPKGGTILGTQRGGPYDTPDGPQRVAESMAAERLDALVVIGGNGSLSVAARLHADLGLPVIGVPKTIDNDVMGTETTFGFHTAVQIATDAIDRLHTTAESHDRVLVVEVMGRHAGWIATYAGIAGGATTVLVPEQPFDIDKVCAVLQKRHSRGRYASIVVVAEGAKSADGRISLDAHAKGPGGHQKLGGIAYLIAPEIEQRTGFETRVTVLGHVQRGGTPTAYDRVLATRYGIGAIDLVHEQAWGQMVSFRGARITRSPLSECLGATRTLDAGMYEVAETFFG
jgi:ATP-dependent phosphofructokinase / diphosphate-dependent phosphofructokinase